MTVVADAGPLVAALNRRDPAHGLAAALVIRLGRSLIVPGPVAVEVDHIVRDRVGLRQARSFLRSLAIGDHASAFLTPGLLRRAVQLDQQYADLDLGLVDAAVMAIAEWHGAPVLTFDFAHFRATRPASGYWRLVVDEAAYADSVRQA